MSAKAEEHEKYPLTVSNWVTVGDSVMPDPHVVEMHNRDAKSSTVQADELLELKKAMVELEAKVMAQRECYPLLSLHQAAILFLYDPGTRFNRCACVDSRVAAPLILLCLYLFDTFLLRGPWTGSSRSNSWPL